jgi:uncharacterized protein
MDILDFRFRPRQDPFYKGLLPKPAPEFEVYFRLYHVDIEKERRFQLLGIEDSLDEMKSFNVTKAVIFSGDSAGNETVAQVCRKYPDSFVGLAGARADRGVTPAVKDLRKAFEEYGFAGLNMSPYLTGVYATDARNFPLYSLCEEMGKCVVIHSSAHYNPGSALDLSDPMQIDKLAVQFPELKLVITHGGYGFGDLGPTIANRHKNVFIDYTAIHPAVLPPWTIKWMNTQLRDKIIFGTNYPCLTFDIIEEWKKVIKPQNQPLFFYENAARVLGLKK